MTFAAWLRSLPSLTGVAPGLDADPLPARPEELFERWIRQAVAAGVPEPHAATLATVDVDGLPDARTLILKDAGPAGWAFASLRASAKGTQLANHPVAALNFWWPPVLRAVRVRGRVIEASAAESAADLAARSEDARSGVAPGDWVLWRLQPEHVEFWEGAADRRHARLRYELIDGEWDHRRADASRSR